MINKVAFQYIDMDDLELINRVYNKSDFETYYLLTHDTYMYNQEQIANGVDTVPNLNDYIAAEPIRELLDGEVDWILLMAQ